METTVWSVFEESGIRKLRRRHIKFMPTTNLYLSTFVAILHLYLAFISLSTGQGSMISMERVSGPTAVST